MERPLNDIEAVLEKRAALIDGRLSLLSYAIEPKRLAEVVAYALAQKGKRLRSTVLTLACEAVGGDVERAIAPAMAVEILHNASLVMDDIIDQSDLRRGNATISHRWGNEMALIACDVMLSLAIREVTRSDVGITKRMVECVAESMLRLGEGEAMEMERGPFAIEDYYRIAEKKTASLFIASAETGALVGNADREQAKALHDYGRHLGLAFQARDDVLDFTATSQQMGKPGFIDLRMNRPTLVMVLAARDGLTRERMLDMERDRLLAGLDPYIAAAGAAAREEAAKARASLEALPDGLARQRLSDLCDYVVRREK